jgi:hypothetical protein
VTWSRAGGGTQLGESWHYPRAPPSPSSSSPLFPSSFYPHMHRRLLTAIAKPFRIPDAQKLHSSAVRMVRPTLSCPAACAVTGSGQGHPGGDEGSGQAWAGQGEPWSRRTEQRRLMISAYMYTRTHTCTGRRRSANLRGRWQELPQGRRHCPDGASKDGLWPTFHGVRKGS